jgi:hypothetical protein
MWLSLAFGREVLLASILKALLILALTASHACVNSSFLDFLSALSYILNKNK